MKIVCLSDIHCQLHKVKVPEGDILVVSGDLTFAGNYSEICAELNKLAKLKARFKHIVVVFGNHDLYGEMNPDFTEELCEERGLIYLDNKAVTLDGINFYGSPYTPEFGGMAFSYDRASGAPVWTKIPDDTHVLITHGPPMGYGDLVPDMYNRSNMISVGCWDLRKRIDELKQLKLHVFGHIHPGHGVYPYGDAFLVNASVCNSQYKPINKVFVIEI